MKALVGAVNQEKALVGAFSVIVQPVVEPMEHEHKLDDPGHAHPYVDRYLDDSAHSQYFRHKEVAHPYYPGVSHAVATSATATGASVAGVSSQYRHGGENRPKNMGIIWIIRVW